MDNQIYRKKSLDTINSPESLNDYIRVASPGIWLILFAVIALLIGAVIWGVFGRIDSVLPVEVTIEEGQYVCYTTDERAAGVKKGMPVQMGEAEGEVQEVMYYDGEEKGALIFLNFDSSPEEGSAEIVLESLRPFSLAFD